MRSCYTAVSAAPLAGMTLTETSQDILSAIYEITPSVDDLANPSKTLNLVFPSDYCPDRDRFDTQFATAENTNLTGVSPKALLFQFYGREELKVIYNKINNLGESGYTSLLFGGILGFGKSHILAAVTVRIMADGNYVVYVPDCGVFRSTGVMEPLRKAMLFAFAHKESCVKVIGAARTFDDLTIFPKGAVGLAKKKGRNIFLILDQINRLETAEGEPALRALRSIGYMIPGIRIVHSASGTSEEFETELARHGSIEHYYVRGGFRRVGHSSIHNLSRLTSNAAQAEAEHWWDVSSGKLAMDEITERTRRGSTV